MAKDTKPKRKSKKPGISVTKFTKIVVPARSLYEYFSEVMEEKKLAKQPGTTTDFSVGVKDEWVVFARRGCDETFVIDREVFQEIAEAVK
jgi:hypothetical protein